MKEQPPLRGERGHFSSACLHVVAKVTPQTSECKVKAGDSPYFCW